ncbi:hypothetical protein VP01_519g3 [Puccinia sorghi]|uniref:Uncharacterized protein n=1 Tax=Puccinia sorghi TaxID=27349 RepID=A0A0L6UKR0_9BASI|nr:hypothetical protein VP01_519g3 [Puccinia sorghi]
MELSTKTPIKTDTEPQQQDEDETISPWDTLPGPSASVDSLGSPRSLLSWHCSDLISIPNSSQSTGSEICSDDHNDNSDIERSSYPLPSRSTSRREQPVPDQSDGLHHPHPLTTELFAAITQHLVMPRLPMIPTPSNNSSRPVSPPARSSPVESITSTPPNPDHSTSRAAPHHPQRKSPRRLGSSSINHQITFSQQSSSIAHNPPKILVVGDAECAHALGALNAHLSLSSTMASCINRAGEILPDFKFSDPRTYNSLIHHIEAPFYRLKAILNPKACYRHHSSLPIPVRNDLLSLINGWIERECYLLLLVEVDSFPVPPARLEFIRTLSRLIPIIPFIPSSVSVPQAIDGHAILTRQLVANRVRHFTMPNPSGSSFPLPEREECLKRSSRFCLDWLAVEFASDSSRSIGPSISSEDELVRGVHRQVLGNEDTDEFEPDKISERVGRRVKRRAKNKVTRRAVKQGSRPGLDQTVPRLAVEKECQPWISTDALSLPSFAGLLRLSLRQVHRDCRLLVKSLVARLLHGSHFAPSPETHTNLDRHPIPQSRPPASPNHPAVSLRPPLHTSVAS